MEPSGRYIGDVESGIFAVEAHVLRGCSDGMLRYSLWEEELSRLLDDCRIVLYTSGRQWYWEGDTMTEEQIDTAIAAFADSTPEEGWAVCFEIQSAACQADIERRCTEARRLFAGSKRALKRYSLIFS